ncbi:cell envelope integrity protein TolA [Marinomonas ostreistagni]|uniref:cell envelope integrity protein TolA n=1 Tax=Marinomonas ostreistagni TaxID=359209 RepID=UPI00195108E4|nr:cell envelope integrity protein TolA [Marinomonas ostreistagni]MBM6549970.1 cell envelope integrity protein TolA [Marinomonas ostreistagni]
MKFLDKENYSLPVVLAVGLHVVVLVGGVVLSGFSESTPEPPKRPPIVNATVIDVSETIIGKREAEQRRAAQAAAEAEQEAKRKAQQQAKRQAELEQQRKAAAAEKQRQEKARQEAEAARQAALEKQRAEQRAKEKKAAEEKARQERIAREKKAAEEEARRQAERERQQELERQRAKEAEIARKAEEQARQEAAERRRRAEEAVKQAMAEEERRLQEQQAGQMVQSISSLINNRITAAWIRPPGARNGMQTLLRISFLPSGEVNNVQVVKGSGDAVFDQKAKDAVYRVGRIEELSEIESYIFERNFRQIDLLFNPQDLRN